MSMVEKRERGSSNDDLHKGKHVSKMSTALNSNAEVFTSPKTSDPNSTPSQDVEDNIQEKDYMNDESPCVIPRGSGSSSKEISKPKIDTEKTTM